MNLHWLQSVFQQHSDLGLWLGISLLLYFFAAIVSWLVGRLVTAVRESASRRWPGWSGRPWLLDILRWAYMIGFPFLLLVSGLLSPSQMGLVDLDWVGTATKGGLVSLASLLLLLIAWRSVLRAERGRSVERKHSCLPLSVAAIVSLAEATALQLHWSFYRSAASALPWQTDSYWTAWMGAGLILLQWGLNPWVWCTFGDRYNREIAVRRGTMLVVTTALFVVAHNLWLPWFVHIAFEFFAQRERYTCSAGVYNPPDHERANGEAK